jgi:hypothetical protein
MSEIFYQNDISINLKQYVFKINIKNLIFSDIDHKNRLKDQL